jgi:hypothetical protein
MNKRAYLKRIEALKARVNQKVITCVMADGSRRTIERSCFLETISEAMLGTISLESEMITASVHDNSGSCLVELLKMCVEEKEASREHHTFPRV